MKAPSFATCLGIFGIVCLLVSFATCSAQSEIRGGQQPSPPVVITMTLPDTGDSADFICTKQQTFRLNKEIPK